MSQNIQEDKYKRAVNFDLNTAELKKIFSSQSPLAYLQGYRQIGRILEKRIRSSAMVRLYFKRANDNYANITSNKKT